VQIVAAEHATVGLHFRRVNMRRIARSRRQIHPENRLEAEEDSVVEARLETPMPAVP
jgi:hypothetical protein